VVDCWFESAEWSGPEAPPKWKQALLMGRNPAALARLREATRASEAKAWLCHNQIPVASFGLYREARDLGVPVIQYCHNFRPFSVSGTLWANGKLCPAGLQGRDWPEIRAGAWQGSILKTAILAWHFRRLKRSGDLDAVRHWITNSEFVRDRFVEAGLPAAKVTAMRYFFNARPAPPPPKDEGYYLFLGRLVEEKGVRTLLNGWGRLERELGKACPRLVIGGTGALSAEVAEAAKRSAAIDYLGFVSGEKKQALIDGCRAMLGPSIWWEPLGIITYEAYDAGKPMLAAASGGLTETVRDGVTGFHHEPGNAASLAESVRKLENLDAAARRAMGAEGREWLLREASPALWRDGFSEILEKCAS
jgi:glycosyltransferase involved in cell wall biosynthesis